MLASLVSWSFSLIFSALLAREVARRVQGSDYRALGAAAYLGVGSVWALGLSSSAALIMAAPASLPDSIENISGVIPLGQTLGLWQSMLVAALLLLSPSEANVDRLLLLLQTRLTVSEDVARAKRASGAAVEDRFREEAVLDAVAKAAPQSGVKPGEARRLFLAQIEASKAAQSRMLEVWRGLAPFPTAPDLAKDVRPRLDALTPAILAAGTVSRTASA